MITGLTLTCQSWLLVLRWHVNHDYWSHVDMSIMITGLMLTCQSCLLVLCWHVNQDYWSFVGVSMMINGVMLMCQSWLLVLCWHVNHDYLSYVNWWQQVLDRYLCKARGLEQKYLSKTLGRWSQHRVLNTGHDSLIQFHIN